MEINMKKLSLIFCLLLSACAQASDNLPSNPFCQKHITSVNLSIGGKVLKSEIACSEAEKEYGLMNRTSLPENNGMLFIFGETQTLSFWMNNTLIDLSVAYVDKDWKIVDIREMKSQDLTPIVSKKPAIFALEANSHWFSKNNIKVGDVIKMTR
jgi:hypothetical protein